MQVPAVRPVEGGEGVVRIQHFLRLRQHQGGAEGEEVLLLAQGQVFIPRLMSQPGDLPGEIERRVHRLRDVADLPCCGAEAQDDQRSRHEDQQRQDQPHSDPPAPPPGRGRRLRPSGGLCRSGRLRRGGQLRHADAEFPGQGQQILHIRRGGAGLPLAHRLAAHAQPGPQLLLGDAQGLSVSTDPLSQRHGHSSFAGPSIADFRGKGHHPGVEYRLRREKIRPRAGKPPPAPRGRAWFGTKGSARRPGFFPGKTSRTPLCKRRKIR